MTSIFISYSRKDVDFAGKIVQTLAEHDLDTWVDWKSIPKGEDWEQEIYRGIEEAETFLFLISPDSIKSDICNREIAHAIINNKRIVPLLVRDADVKNFFSDGPRKEISRLNWIFTRDGQDNLSKAIEETLTTIHTDYDWLKYHTRLQVKALEWRRSNHESSLLLRGKDLQDAEARIVTNSSKEPNPTDLQRNYVLRSRQASDKQRRFFTIGAIIVAIVMTGLAIFGFDQAGQARSAEVTAVANASIAETERANAVASQKLAEERANIARSRQLAAQAQATFIDHPELGLLLAIEAAQFSEETLGSYLPVTKQALRSSISQIRIAGRPFPNTNTGDGSYLSASAISPDGRWAATASASGKIYLWDLQSSVLQPVTFKTEVESLDHLRFSPDGRWLVNSSAGKIYLWAVKNSSSEPMVWETDSDSIGTFEFSPDKRWLAAGSADKIFLWDVKNPLSEPIVWETNSRFIEAFEFSPDGRWLEAGNGIWDLQDLPDEPVLIQSEDGIRQIADLSPDGNWLVVSSLNEDQIASVSLHDLRDLSADPIILYRGTTFLRQLIFSPQGNWLSAGGSSQTYEIYYWDLQAISNRPVALQYNDTTGNLTFSPDDRWLAIGNEQSITIWNMQDVSAAPRMIPGRSTWFFSKNGQWLFTDSGAWDMYDPSADPIPMEDEEDILAFIEFSPDGRWLLMSNTCYLHLWNTEDLSSGPIVVHGHELRNCGPVPNGNWITSQTFSTDSRWLVTTDANWNTWLWDVGNLVNEPVVFPHDGRKFDIYEIRDLVFSPDGHWLITSSMFSGGIGRLPQMVVRRWDMRDMDEGPVFLPIADALMASPTGRWLALRSNAEDVVRLWDLQNSTSEPMILQQVDTVVFSPDERWLATLITDSEYNSVAYLGDLQNLSKSFIHVQDGKGIQSITFSPDGRWLAIATHDGQIRILDLESSSPNWVDLINMGDPRDLLFSPSGRWLSAISSDHKKSIDLWDTTNFSLKQVELSSAVDLLKFSPDDHWLVVGGYGKFGIYFFDKEDSLKKTSLPRMGEADARVFAFSPNGHWLATGGYNGDIHLWDLRNTDGVPTVIQGIREPVDMMVFSGDSELLVAGTGVGTVLLWDMRDNLAEPVVIQHPNLLSTLAISPDRQWLATGGGGYPAFDNGDHDVRLWHLNLEDLLSISCQADGRNFTRAEWAQYFPDKPYPATQEVATCPQWPLEPEVKTTP